MRNRIDPFVTNHLPADCLLPDMLPTRETEYCEFKNATEYFLDRWCGSKNGTNTALLGDGESYCYNQVQKRVSQYAKVLVEDFGLIPGNRVLLRGFNSPQSAMLHLAVLRVGGVIVSTMPLLRSSELKKIVKKAHVTHAICEVDLLDDIVKVQAQLPWFKVLGSYSSNSEKKSLAFFDINELADAKNANYKPYACGLDWPALIAFTSGTTGEPKGTVHFHKDLLAICETFSREVLKPVQSDIFCGTPPLAFTYGLGGSLLFPMSVGASTLLLDNSKPLNLLKAIEKFRTTICFSSPTAYRMMLDKFSTYDISSLKKCVSAGETLPKSTFLAFEEQTGLKLIDGIGSTEMLHIFISSSENEICPGSTGKVVEGYQAAILDDEGKEVPNGTIGWLAVKGPTGCRYLSDDRQKEYIRDGWNVTGDAYLKDDNGYFWYQSRMDDMIISSGHNISAPEVENALLSHSSVSECAVIGIADETRGSIVKAYVVLKAQKTPSLMLVKILQDHVKQSIAPYKYPREIEFIAELPKTLTGKLKRFALRESNAA